MHPKLTPTAALLLTIPPLMWAGNAVVGRLVSELVSPMTLNLLRWLIAFALLLPLAGGVLKKSSRLWPNWRRFGFLGLLNYFVHIFRETKTAVYVVLVPMPIFIYDGYVGIFDFTFATFHN